MKYASTLLALFLLLPTTHAQIIVGDRPTPAEADTAKQAEASAKQTLSKLEAKKITLAVGEFEELVPRKGTTTPYLWISNDNGIVTRHEIEKGQAFAVMGKRRGTKDGTPYDLHTFPPREFRWAIIVVSKAPEPLYGKDGKPVTLKATISVIKNGDNGTPEEADLIEVTVGNTAPIIPPIKPDDPVKPDIKPDPVKPDAELVKQLKQAMSEDKTAAAQMGLDWGKASVWAGTYSDTAKLLKSGDPALAVSNLADLYAKHKLAWLANEVPPVPFLAKTRSIIDAIFDAELGKSPTATVDRAKASALFARLHLALTEALKP